MRSCKEISPPVAVSSIYVHTKLHQELHYLRVAGAHGVVERRDALVVGQARVLHLEGKEEDGHCSSACTPEPPRRPGSAGP